MITHKRNHTGELPYQCLNCDESFKLKSDLKKHQEKLHQDVKPFSCSICNKSFALRSVMKNHMKIHIGLKPYKCPYPGCNKSFIEKGNMKSHFRIHVILYFIFKDNFVNYLEQVDPNHFNIIKKTSDIKDEQREQECKETQTSCANIFKIDECWINKTNLFSNQNAHLNIADTNITSKNNSNPGSNEILEEKMVYYTNFLNKFSSTINNIGELVTKCIHEI